MGTRTGKIVLLLAVIGLGLSSLAWAAAPEEVVTVPAPVITPPTMVAQAPVAVAMPVPSAPPEACGVTQDTSGIAYYYDDRDWEVWINLGANNGLRPCAQVSFCRCGQVVATGVVKTVRDADAIVTPSPGTPAGQIHKGDAVRVTCNGTRADLDRVINEERKWELWGEIGLTALLAGLIAVGR